jgi:hypothetical protein
VWLFDVPETKNLCGSISNLLKIFTAMKQCWRLKIFQKRLLDYWQVSWKSGEISHKSTSLFTHLILKFIIWTTHL